MRTFLTIALIGAGFVPRAGHAQAPLGGTCSACGCPDGRVFAVSTAECPPQDANFERSWMALCVQKCGGAGESADASLVLIESYFRLTEQVRADQRAGHVQTTRQFDEEFPKKQHFNPLPCREALTQIEAAAQSFASEAESEGLKFAARDAFGVAKKLGRAGRNEGAWMDALKGVLEFQKRVRAWSDDLEAYAACSGRPGCDALTLLKQVNRELRAFLKQAGASGAIGRVEHARAFLEDYGRRLQAAQEQNTQRALACVGAPP